VHFITSAVCDCDRLGDEKSLTNFQGGLEWVDGNKLCDLDYADDIALIETSQISMQLMTVEKILRRVGLRMNAEKCKIMVNNNWEDSTVITAEGTNVEVVEDFCYLGRSRTGNCDKECMIRIGKVASVFGRLINIWNSKNIRFAVKIRLMSYLSSQPCCMVQNHGHYLSHK